MRNRRVWLLVGAFGLWGLMGCGGSQSGGGTTAPCAGRERGDCPCHGDHASCPRRGEGGDHADCPCHRGEGGDHADCPCHRGEGGEHADCPCHRGEGAEHGERGEHGEGGEHRGEPENLPPAVAAFHEAMGPVWHSEPGAARGALACQSSAAFTERARAVSAEAAPAGADAAAWQTAAVSLSQAVAALATECGTPAHANAEQRLSAMHDAFHALTELVPGDD